MDSDFSHKLNDEKSVKVARRISDRFPPGTLSADTLAPLCEFLSEYAKLDYAGSMAVLNRIEFGGSPFDMLRLAYALVHYDPRVQIYTSPKALQAHGKVLSVTADGMHSANPRLCLRILVVSSADAGSILDYELGLRDAVKLQKKVYCGRSRALSGRSMLELVGCQLSLRIKGRLVVSVDADKAEKKYNKQLCTDRVKADSTCVRASTCALCAERRKSCRLAVRT